MPKSSTTSQVFSHRSAQDRWPSKIDAGVRDEDEVVAKKNEDLGDRGTYLETNSRRQIKTDRLNGSGYERMLVSSNPDMRQTVKK